MKDITGNVYGDLTVIECVGKNKEGRHIWLCQCSCGQTKKYYKNNLDNGRAHCGCKANKGPNKIHGLRQHELYSVWNSMINRCENPKSKSYRDYGGRGIFVCERWRSVEAFIEDMAPRPSGSSIDRIDNDGPYSPENVRWATSKQQRWNQRKICKVFSSGETIQDVANRQGVSPATIRMRIHRNWSDEEILDGRRKTKDS